MNRSSSCLLFALCPRLTRASLCDLWGLGCRPGCGSGCRLDSSDFTQGCVSPRGDTEMSASVSLCLSSKPCQRQLSSHSITTLSLRVSLCFAIWDAQTVQARHPPPDSSAVLIAYVTQQRQGQGVSHVSACGFESACATVALLSALVRESRVCHLAWMFWVTAWVRWIQAAALCKSAPTFSSHKFLLATNCHRWQPSQRKEREGRQGVRGLKKSLRDEIKAKKGTWQHLEKRHCLRGEIYLCKNSLISQGWEQGRACKAGSRSPLSREKRRRRRKCSWNSRSASATDKRQTTENTVFG